MKNINIFAAILVIIGLGLFGTFILRGKINQRKIASVPAPVIDPTRAKISIVTDPADSIIEINGVTYGNAPAQILLPLRNKFKLSFKHLGYAPFMQEITVLGPQEVRVTLQKVAPAKPTRSAASEKKKPKKKPRQ